VHEIRRREPRVCGPIDVNNPVTQYLIPPFNYISGICLRFGTYCKVMTHHVELRLDSSIAATRPLPITATLRALLISVRKSSRRVSPTTVISTSISRPSRTAWDGYLH
jgi:hypothetical protein